MMIGLDTGYFLKLLSGDERAMVLWRYLLDQEQQAVTSALSLFEIKHFALMGMVEIKVADVLCEAIVHVCKIVWIEGYDILTDAAILSNELKLPSTAAIILAGFVKNRVKRIYTTDSYFDQLKKDKIEIIKL